MTTPTRPQRADAVRNRVTILDAARDQITLHGPDVGMVEIAAAAGVAVGTLYRHFPTKTDLVAAVMAGYVTEVADDAEATLARARAGASPVEEIIGFLDRVVESAAYNHAVKAAARGLGVEGHGDDTHESRAGVALAELIRAAQATGGVREGITVDDIYLLMATVPSDHPESARKRWLDLIVNGIAS